MMPNILESLMLIALTALCIAATAGMGAGAVLLWHQVAAVCAQ